MNKILITGCLGFIGQNLIRFLKTKNKYDIIGVDKCPSFVSNLTFTLLQKDILNLTTNDLSGVSDVIHLAARTGVRASASEPNSYFENNVKGTQHLLELCSRTSISRFFFASSSSVYGDHPGLPEGSLPIGPEACKSFYALTKHQGEVLTWFYSCHFPIQCFCMRFFTVYGPSPRKDMLIGKGISSAIEETPLPFFGNPSESLRSFTFVDDLCYAISGLLDFETSEKWSAWNLGNPCNIDCSTVLTLLSTELSKYEKTLQIQYFSKDSQDTQETLANIQKAQTLLGWNPTTSLQEGITKTVSSVLGFS